MFYFLFGVCCSKFNWLTLSSELSLAFCHCSWTIKFYKCSKDWRPHCQNLERNIIKSSYNIAALNHEDEHFHWLPVLLVTALRMLVNIVNNMWLSCKSCVALFFYESFLSKLKILYHDKWSLVGKCPWGGFEKKWVSSGRVTQEHGYEIIWNSETLLVT